MKDNKLISQILDNVDDLDLDKEEISTNINDEDRLLSFITRSISGQEPKLNLSNELSFLDKLFF